MKIEYILYASFAKHMPKGSDGRVCELEIAADLTLGMLIERLQLPEKSSKMVFVNGLRAKEEAVLRDGDRVGIFPLVAGG